MFFRFAVLSLICINACQFDAGLDLQKAATQEIYYGTVLPQNTFLTTGEIMAVGFLTDASGSAFCSGTIVDAHAVITARHCLQGRSIGNLYFGIGPDDNNPIDVILVDEMHPHSSIDFGVMLFYESLIERLPGLVPINMNREVVDDSWNGRWVDASGFGRNQNHGGGIRFFGSVEIYRNEPTRVHVDGHGQQGICYGDSGGPIIWQPDELTAPVVVGTEQTGDWTCVDRDQLARVDVVAPWVDGLIATVQPPDCTGIPMTGICMGQLLRWCDVNNTVHTENCGAQGAVCLLDDVSSTYICDYPCDGVPLTGQCNGEVLEYCDGINTITEDCAAINSFCGYQSSTSRYGCLNFCDAIATGGECDGQTLKYCDSGRIAEEDCTASGMRCGQVDANGGRACLSATCGYVDFLGSCVGQTLAWCDDTGMNQRDCLAENKVCHYTGPYDGFDCVDCVDCNGACINTNTDKANCGACNNVCSNADGSSSCNAGACVVGHCPAGYADGDGVYENGCEVAVEESGGGSGGCSATPIISWLWLVVLPIIVRRKID